MCGAPQFRIFQSLSRPSFLKVSVSMTRVWYKPLWSSVLPHPGHCFAEVQDWFHSSVEMDRSVNEGVNSPTTKLKRKWCSGSLVTRFTVWSRKIAVMVLWHQVCDGCVTVNPLFGRCKKARAFHQRSVTADLKRSDASGRWVVIFFRSCVSFQSLLLSDM